MTKQINFIIIGAQKAGSTYLYNILNSSNDIFMPQEKELPFFLEKDLDEKKYNQFIDDYFHKSKKYQIIGTSTPQYMMYPESFKDIKTRLPNIKIIAILREPIKRLISHYDMACRFGKETRSINLVIKNQLENLEYFRKSPFDDSTGKYIVAGEYGRIFLELLKHFEKKKILVLLFKDLINEPKKEIEKITNFLDFETKINRFNKFKNMRGGKKKFIEIDLYKIVSSLNRIGIKKIMPNFIIKKIRIFLSFIDNINVDIKSKTSISEIKPELLEKLKDHYKKDLNLLKNTLDIEINVE